MNRSINEADALRDEIAHTRAELGETVQALAARADVPARARASAQRGADRMRVASSRPGVWLVVGAGAAAVATIVAMARIRRSRRGWGGFGRRRLRGWL
ncbi:DUF3618 domain-containing protein [Natronosporangium hydrolyticum]|uniref:DUF3618 domain-containing protein n=1 Tax=Natronosporangium hydrolyticum TaxID=2811111 RepID=A0A895YN85_9ACTN|nr:DUF3618 domain-containing protein [Natronosporangium hydrolyticum]QSB16919.1 DUF3618 domain-containing protein [Natronosporangium hydrolyticum]